MTCSQTEDEANGTRVTTCSDGTERTEQCTAAVGEDGTTTTTCVITNYTAPARLQASYTEWLGIQRDTSDQSSYELAGAYFT